MKILFADDDKLNSLMIKKLFDLWGFKVDMVSDGGQALDLARTKPYDFYIFDIQMPSVDGLRLAGILRDMGIKQPIVALTSVSDAEAAVLLADGHFSALLRKPFLPADLLGLLQAQ